MTSEKYREPTFQNKQTLIILLFILIFGLSSCQRTLTPSSTGTLTVKANHQEKETEDSKLARQKASTLHKKLLQYFPTIKKPVLKKYIKQVGQNLIQTITTDIICCRFYLLDMNSINAFSLPNGNIYITLQLLALLDNEAELAAILSHEISHIIAKHSARKIHHQSTSSKVHQALQRGQAPRINDISTTLKRVYEKGFKREIENEADKLGLQYMVSAGYHPLAMINVFQKIENHFKSKPKHQKYIELVYIRNRGIFASYPSFSNRIQYTRVFIGKVIAPKIVDFPLGLIFGKKRFAPIKIEIHNILHKARTKH